MITMSGYAIWLWKLCLWREARGQHHDAKFAAAYSIYNRASRPSWWGTDIVSVILKPWQYSSFNRGDPNSTKFPQENDTSWMDCDAAVEEVMAGKEDITSGATHYFDKSLDANPPKWATDPKMVHTADIGDFHFYRAS